jgi:hypothetical protein
VVISSLSVKDSVLLKFSRWSDPVNGEFWLWLVQFLLIVVRLKSL